MTAFHRLPRATGIMLLFLLLVSGFGRFSFDHAETGQDQSYDIRPLSEVYAERPPAVIDLLPTHATLDFVSSIALACSVVFGETEAFGQIAVDPTMAGAAIIEHHPIMGDLRPDTEYLYRVQGSDANGIIYISELFSFKTPPETSGEINLASLAAGASIADVSSNFGGAANDDTWGANKAIDGNPATAWSSHGDGDDAYLMVQLSQPDRPHAVEVWTRFMSNGTARITSFNITSDTGERFGPFTLPDATQPYRFETPFASTVQTLRFDVVSSTGGNTGLVEFAALAEPMRTSYLPVILTR